VRKRVLIGCLAAAMAAPAAHAGVLNATLVEDTAVASTNPTTNMSGERFVPIRAVSAATRAGLFQFDLPALPTGQVVTQVDFTAWAGAVAADFVLVDVLGTTSAMDLSTITWNSAISAGVLQGTGKTAGYTPDWGAMWTKFAGEELDIDGWVNLTSRTYTDADDAAGLLKFVQDNISTTGPVRITLGFGFSITEDGTGGFQFRSQNDSGSGTTTPPGPYTATLVLTTAAGAEPIPEPASALLVLAGAGVLARRRRR